ncbi:MAG: serine hydrolase [Candidatus Aminicenantaceae bacterium]
MRKMSKALVCVLCAAILMAPSFEAAQKDPYAKKLKPLERFIPEVMADWQVPGLAISIIKDGRLIYAQGFGYSDVAGQKEVTSRTLFAIGSCTKAFTAVTMGMLVDEGEVEWDERVTTYLPRFKLKDDFATTRMTPRDLLCHRSGLPRHDLLWYNSSATREELFSRLQYLEPSQDFRTHYQYQNLMFMTAGYLVEQVTGTSWEKFVENRIFYPLGMTDSNFSVEASRQAPDHALPYVLKDKEITAIPFRNIDTIGPAGSINSHVTDMANWVLLNLNKGKFGDQEIVSESSLTEIHSPQMISGRSLRYDETFYSLYGMGWGMTSYRGHVLLSHGGGIDGFSALVSLMPKDNMGLVILTNLDGTPIPQAVMYQVYDRLLDLEPVDWNGRLLKQREEREKEAEQAEKKEDADRVADTRPTLVLEAYAGDYAHPGYGVLRVVHKGSSLEMSYNDISYQLEHYHYDVFQMENEMMDLTQKLSFALDLKGNIGSVSVPLESAVDPIVFVRMPEKKMRERAFLEQFVGEYLLNEIVLKIYLKSEDTLYTLVPGQPEYELEPYKGTQFTLKGIPGVSIEFIQDESGQVSEAKITQPEGVFTAKKK